ncbi:unnamed protein product [Caenorhabditis auriculariae]|uniref:Uncharacterized protein n=1 Tax=Caenorhabditis auriculariae TaxID=2777116 RepID=A0A8S1HAT9_9PELO|nr:unnamed protein product [Caenorhabditis auriculariae]
MNPKEETIERHMELEEQIEYSIKEKELAEANKSIEEYEYEFDRNVACIS